MRTLLVLAAWVLTAMSASASERVALIIGNANYQNAPALNTPIGDANAMAKLLADAGFEVGQVLTDLDDRAFRKALQDFEDRSSRSEVAVIFYAGHGIRYEDENYLVPTNAVLARANQVQDQAIPLKRLLGAAQHATKLRLIILDACSENPFRPKMQDTVATRRLTLPGLARPDVPGNTVIALSAKEGSLALDLSRNVAHSPYTEALLRHLTTPGLDVMRALDRVRDDVLYDTGNRQEPMAYGSPTLTVSLSPAAAPAAVETQPSASSDDGVRRDYELAAQAKSAEAWEIFIARYPSGFYSQLAAVNLRKLKAEQASVTAENEARAAQAERQRLERERSQSEELQKARIAEQAAKAAQKAAELASQRERERAEAAERARIEAESNRAREEARTLKAAEAKIIDATTQASDRIKPDPAQNPKPTDKDAAQQRLTAIDKDAEARRARLPNASPANPAQDCDRLAADPRDPDKPANVAGVLDTHIVVEAAIAACTKSIAQANLPRQRYQLARAYIASQRYGLALAELNAADRAGYRRATYALAQLHLAGKGTPLDGHKGIQLLEAAAARGERQALAELRCRTYDLWCIQPERRHYWNEQSLSIGLKEGDRDLAASAAMTIAENYAFGRGVKVSPGKAAESVLQYVKLGGQWKIERAPVKPQPKTGSGPSSGTFDDDDDYSVDLTTFPVPVRKSLQEQLIAGGFLSGKADGVLGAATGRALTRYCDCVRSGGSFDEE